MTSQTRGTKFIISHRQICTLLARGNGANISRTVTHYDK